MTGFVNYLRGQGYNVVVGAQGGYLKPAVPITREALQNVGVILITTPKVAYTADEIAVLKEFVEGGGSVILASQSDYLKNNRPGHFNSIAEGLGGAVRFNDDQVNDSVNRDSTYSHSIVTDEFDPDHPELLRARYQD